MHMRNCTTDSLASAVKPRPDSALPLALTIVDVENLMVPARPGPLNRLSVILVGPTAAIWVDDCGGAMEDPPAPPAFGRPGGPGRGVFELGLRALEFRDSMRRPLSGLKSLSPLLTPSAAGTAAGGALALLLLLLLLLLLPLLLLLLRA